MKNAPEQDVTSAQGHAPLFLYTFQLFSWHSYYTFQYFYPLKNYVCEVYRYRESGQKTVLTDAYEFPIADGEDYVMLVICVPVRWKVPE